MAFFTILTIFLGIFSLRTDAAKGVDNSFNAYYSYLWGGDHFSIDPQGSEVQLKMDRSSGAGFRSKWDYGSGVFRIQMKIPERKTGGAVTSFYLTEVPSTNQIPGNHFEFDFEFLGTTGVVQTNVYDNDTGHREQSFKLWFDPSRDFHTYEFVWNSYQIIFLIDNIPLRVFKNNKAQGVAYPDRPMHIEASIWNADWAGNVNWSNAPFIAHYRDFGFYACRQEGHNIALPDGGASAPCDSDQLFWNRPNYRQLDGTQLRRMARYRRKYMTYDYCSDPNARKKECSLNA